MRLRTQVRDYRSVQDQIFANHIAWINKRAETAITDTLGTHFRLFKIPSP
jgi:hypothetical protein